MTLVRTFVWLLKREQLDEEKVREAVDALREGARYVQALLRQAGEPANDTGENEYTARARRIAAELASRHGSKLRRAARVWIAAQRRRRLEGIAEHSRAVADAIRVELS